MSPLEQETESILRKMSAVIDSSGAAQKHTATRYLSLCNVRLHQLFEASKDWGIIGASLALKGRYMEKFGTFFPAYEPVTSNRKTIK
jgi:hypothetical protein